MTPAERNEIWMRMPPSEERRFVSYAKICHPEIFDDVIERMGEIDKEVAAAASEERTP